MSIQSELAIFVASIWQYVHFFHISWQEVILSQSWFEDSIFESSWLLEKKHVPLSKNFGPAITKVHNLLRDLRQLP